MTRMADVLLAAATGLTALAATVTSGCPGPEPQRAATTGGAGGSTTSSTGAEGGAGGVGGAGGGTTSCPEVDVLVVVDNSPSMNDLQAAHPEIFVALGGVKGAIEDKFDGTTSLHVGFVTATEHTQNPAGCQMLGALSTRGGLGGADDCVTAEGGPFMTEADAANVGELFNCMAIPGQNDNGEGQERAISALLAALGQPPDAQVASCNGGFSRPGVPLVVVIVADEDDVLTAGDPQSWFEDLMAVKQVTSDELGLVAVIPDPGAGDCNAGGGGPTNLHAFALEFDDLHQFQKNLCDLANENLEDTVDAVWDSVCAAP